MANDVQVRFGASIGDLIDAVDKVKESINSIGEVVTSANEKFTALAEIAGVSLGFEGLKTFVEGMAELGSKTESSMAVLGMSAHQVGELSGVAKLSGTSFEALSTTIERMSLNVQKSARDAFNPAAEGLRVLGLSARELVGLPTDQYFQRLAEAVSKFNPSLNLTNALTAVAGRGAATLVPVLLQGAEAYREMEAAVARTGATLDDAQAHAFAQTHEKLALMSLSVEGFGIKIFSVLKPAIDAAAVSFAAWLQSFKVDDIRDEANVIGNVLIDIGKSVSLFFVDARERWQDLVLSIEQKMPALSAAAFAFYSMTGQVSKAYAALKAALEGPAPTETFDSIASRAAGARHSIEALAQTMHTGLNASVPKSGTWDAEIANAKLLDQEITALGQSYTKMNAAAMQSGGKDATSAAISAAQERIRLADISRRPRS
jgi:hypothetical protein